MQVSTEFQSKYLNLKLCSYTNTKLLQCFHSSSSNRATINKELLLVHHPIEETSTSFKVTSRRQHKNVNQNSSTRHRLSNKRYFFPIINVSSFSKISDLLSSFLQIPVNLIILHRFSQNNAPTIDPYLVVAPDRNQIIQLSSDLALSENDPDSDDEAKPRQQTVMD